MYDLYTCVYESRRHAVSFSLSIPTRVIMSITFVAVLTLLTAGAKSSDDNVFYSDTAGVGTGGVDDEWADEALLDVAFYLRLHKFDDFDRR